MKKIFILKIQIVFSQELRIKYIKICSRIENGDAVTYRTLTPYRFSTLRNFHNELGIAISKEDFINQLKDSFQ